ncbi:methyltransferase-domain-containing protein [Endogone sp. FLAS-F59071]|nr:methyltransferase-domain-containing protein [Endogone sp. FLAS-F59071]|eukprot:RUS20258.1 methyltransferase-domain-containing protein [Endogone sp. FLAS-F59071]
MLFEVKDWNIGTFVPDKLPSLPTKKQKKSDIATVRAIRPAAGDGPAPDTAQRQQKRKRNAPEQRPGGTKMGENESAVAEKATVVEKAKRQKRDKNSDLPAANATSSAPNFVSVLTAPEDKSTPTSVDAIVRPSQKKKKKKQNESDSSKKTGGDEFPDHKKEAAEGMNLPVAEHKAKTGVTDSTASNSQSQEAIAHKKLSKKEKQKLKAVRIYARNNETSLRQENALARTTAAETKPSFHSTVSIPAVAKEMNIENEPLGLTPLQQQMRKKLSGARFRWINEQLYTTSSNKSFQLFREKPEMFEEVCVLPYFLCTVAFHNLIPTPPPSLQYHAGFRSQVDTWPTNPVDVLIDQLRVKPTNTIIADLGCGDAKIACVLAKYKVLSFDFVAKNEKVVACDIAKIPIPPGFVDVAVFCLSLMGTNYIDFLMEASRILKPNGELKIAEVISRFPDVDAFVDVLEKLGFDLVSKDDSNTMFILFNFVKRSGTGAGSSKKGGCDGRDARAYVAQEGGGVVEAVFVQEAMR